MKKNILLFVLAIVCGLSLTIAGTISAFAGFSNGTFEIDEILANYDQYKAVQTENVGIVDLSGYYRISVEYGPFGFDLDSTEPLLLFDAPDGFYVYFRNNYLNTPLYGFDSIYIVQEGTDRFILGVLNGEQTRITYSMPGDQYFFTPELSTYGDGEQNKVFTTADFVTVLKLGDVTPTPPTPPGDNAVYNNIDEVWGDLWGNMTAWLSDADKYFLTDGSLTALGLCCAIPIGVGVVMLLVHIIMKFLRLRG